MRDRLCGRMTSTTERARGARSLEEVSGIAPPTEAVGQEEVAQGASCASMTAGWAGAPGTAERCPRRPRTRPCLCPPHPEVAARHFLEYESRGRDFGLSFPQYQAALGLVHVDEEALPRGLDIPTEICCCPTSILMAMSPPPDSENGDRQPSAAVPAEARDAGVVNDNAGVTDITALSSDAPQPTTSGKVSIMILLVDFGDQEAEAQKPFFEELFFSRGVLPRGSVAEYYDVASLGNVSLDGEVHGWFRMPENYAAYTNGAAGLGKYPANSQKLVEDAVKVALESGVSFGPELSFANDGFVDGLIVIHAGEAAELQYDRAEQVQNIWSHSWIISHPLPTTDLLSVYKYAMVSEQSTVGICAHEVGHLIFGWEDFYDVSGVQGGQYWDGSRAWDLMGSGCWNGKNADCPALPAVLHRVEQNWIEVEEVTSTVRKLVVPPHSPTFSKAVKVVSPLYGPNQYLLLETRSMKKGTVYDSALNGEGLLVWKVDLDQGQSSSGAVQFSQDTPRMRLVEADGRGSLLALGNYNSSNSGDSFPGSTRRTTLDDNLGLVSTSFPGGPAGGVELQNISYNGRNGNVTLDIVFLETGMQKPTPGGDSVDVLDALDAEPTSEATKRSQGKYVKLLKNRDTEEVVGDDSIPTQLHVAMQENNADVQISNKNPAGALARVRIGMVGLVAAVEIEVMISHRRNKDLHMQLVSPAGKPVRIYHHGKAAGGSIASTSVNSDQFKLSISDPQVFKPLIGVQASGAWGLRVCDTRGGWSDGRLKMWRIVLTLVDNIRSVSETVIAKAIILEGVGITSSIDIKQKGHVKEVGIEVGISHTVATHIHAELMAPSGEIVLLSGKLVNGKSGSMLLGADSANDLQLAPMIGTSIHGTWTLRLTDILGERTSTLDAWNLNIQYVPMLPTRGAVGFETTG